MTPIPEETGHADVTAALAALADRWAGPPAARHGARLTAVARHRRRARACAAALGVGVAAAATGLVLVVAGAHGTTGTPPAVDASPYAAPTAAATSRPAP